MKTFRDEVSVGGEGGFVAFCSVGMLIPGIICGEARPRFWRAKTKGGDVFVTALIAVFACAFSASTQAQEKPEPTAEELEWIQEITTIAPGKYRDLRPVRIDFGLSWNNVLNAGELAVILEQSTEPSERLWIGRAEGRSNGLARALWPYDVEATSRINPQSLQPSLFQLSETERGKKYRYQLTFEPAKVRTRTIILPKTKGEEEAAVPEVKESTYRYEAIQDILSTALLLRSQSLEKGDSVKMLVSPFNRPYYTEFKSHGREERKVKGDKYDTIRLGVTIRKVNHNKTLQDYDKMKEATIWLSDDEFRLPVEIHADIFVGFVSARAEQRQWLDGSEMKKESGAKAEEPQKSSGGFLQKITGGKKAGGE